jgi:CRISPR-associated protein Cas1
MKKIGNVLYITTPEAFLSLEGETVVVKKEEGKSIKLPLHNLEAIVCFNYPGVSPALMGACAERDIGLTFLKPSGRFLARVTGRVKGNLLLRKKQYQLAQYESARVSIAVSCLLGKIANSRVVIERALRDHALLVDVPVLQVASDFLKATLPAIRAAEGLDTLRGLEGSAAKQYFRVFGELTLHQKEDFPFKERNRRPPLDNMNSLLSFFYTLLTYEVTSALETVGLDPQVGFLHADRPGRPSLALDLMEELRPVFADRLALTLVNRKQIKGSGFVQKESGGVLMDDDTRKKVITV